jgi:cell wall-associated NlpC family hydrolase
MKMSSLLVALVLFLTAPFVEASQTYVVKKGDNLYRIAKRFKVDQQTIQDSNNLDSTALRPGLKLVIPSKLTSEEHKAVKREKKASGSPSTVSMTRQMSPAPQEARYHTVRKGDTVSSIAKKYSLSVADLKALNNFSKTPKLKRGQQLLVKKAGPKTYTVKKGDTIGKIAKKTGVSAEELQALNELESDDVTPGQNLYLEPSWAEEQEPGTPRVVSAARISEDIKTLAASPELGSLGMQERLILFARKMLDIPYRFGGSTFMGIDCSGYVQKVFGLLDVSLPRTAREQYHLGEPVSKEDLLIGDLVFFRTYASFPSHVGIYLGNNLFIHASSRSRKVSIDSLDTPYYVRRFIGAKRLFEDQLDKRIVLKDQG